LDCPNVVKKLGGGGVVCVVFFPSCDHCRVGVKHTGLRKRRMRAGPQKRGVGEKKVEFPGRMGRGGGGTLQKWRQAEEG